jgi:glutamate racemase
MNTLVFGCTHLPFVLPLIQDITSSEVQVIDPASAVARRVAGVLEAHGLRAASSIRAAVRLCTNGSAEKLRNQTWKLLNRRPSVRTLL